MVKTVVLMVGPYGSGKSKAVKELQSKLPKDVTSVVCSSSFFFLHNGVYRFEATKLSEAFSSTRRKFLFEINKGTDVIFVDDTHLKFQYRKFYLEHAIENGYQVEIRVMPSDKKVQCDLLPGRYLVYDGDEDIECEYHPLESEPVAQMTQIVQPIYSIGQELPVAHLVGQPGHAKLIEHQPKPTPSGPAKGTVFEEPNGNIRRFNGDRWISYAPVPEPPEIVRL